MRLWAIFKEFFLIRSSEIQNHSTHLDDIYNRSNPGFVDPRREINIDAIKFDNYLRLGVSVLALLTAVLLWLGHAISYIGPAFLLFMSYVAIQILSTWTFLKFAQPKKLNFCLASIDIVGYSLALILTGGMTSPLIFIFFIPLIVQAFHRAWDLLLFYGVGGISFLSIFALSQIPHWTTGVIVGLGSRILFIGLTMAIALYAVNHLRRKEDIEQRRLSRLKCMVNISQLLNGVCLLKDLHLNIVKVLQLLNLELEKTTGGWTQVYLLERGEPLLQAIQDPARVHSDMKQTLTVQSCPAIQGSTSFVSNGTIRETGCPNENFSFFKSHACVPIRGEMGEIFGVLFSASINENDFPTEELQFFQFISTSLGLSIQRLKRMEELNSAFEMDSCAMATFMGSTRNLEDTFGAIADGIRTILNADQVNIFLWDPEKSRLESRFVLGAYRQEGYGLSFIIGDGIPGRVLESGKPIWTYDHENLSLNQIGGPFRGLLCIPLQTIQGEPLGVLTAAILDPQRTFSIEEIDLASIFCTRATVAIENARMHLMERGERIDKRGTIDPPQQKAA